MGGKFTSSNKIGAGSGQKEQTEYCLLLHAGRGRLGYKNVLDFPRAEIGSAPAPKCLQWSRV
eukprot:6843582-Ditylum_brightwellii.AAC.1